MAATVSCEKVAVAIAKGMKLALPLLKDGAQLKDLLDLYTKVEGDIEAMKIFAEAMNALPGVEAEVKQFDFFGGLRVFRAFMGEYKKP